MKHDNGLKNSEQLSSWANAGGHFLYKSQEQGKTQQYEAKGFTIPNNGDEKLTTNDFPLFISSSNAIRRALLENGYLPNQEGNWPDIASLDTSKKNNDQDTQQAAKKTIFETFLRVVTNTIEAPKNHMLLNSAQTALKTIEEDLTQGSVLKPQLLNAVQTRQTLVASTLDKINSELTSKQEVDGPFSTTSFSDLNSPTNADEEVIYTKVDFTDLPLSNPTSDGTTAPNKNSSNSSERDTVIYADINFANPNQSNTKPDKVTYSTTSFSDLNSPTNADEEVIYTKVDFTDLPQSNRAQSNPNPDKVIYSEINFDNSSSTSDQSNQDLRKWVNTGGKYLNGRVMENGFMLSESNKALAKEQVSLFFKPSDTIRDTLLSNGYQANSSKGLPEIRGLDLNHNDSKSLQANKQVIYKALLNVIIEYADKSKNVLNLFKHANDNLVAEANENNCPKNKLQRHLSRSKMLTEAQNNILPDKSSQKSMNVTLSEKPVFNTPKPHTPPPKPSIWAKYRAFVRSYPISFLIISAVVGLGIVGIPAYFAARHQNSMAERINSTEPPLFAQSSQVSSDINRPVSSQNFASTSNKLDTNNVVSESKNAQDNPGLSNGNDEGSVLEDKPTGLSYPSK